MSRTLRRGAVAAVIVAIAPVLAACSAGSSAATLQIKPNTAATSVSLPNGGGEIKLNGVAVVTDAKGNAPANIVASIANLEGQPETLISVTVDGTAATLTGGLRIPQGGALSLSTPGQGNPVATVPTLTQPAGANIPVTFVFANAGQVKIMAQIQLGTGDWASYAPASPTPTLVPLAPAASGKPGHKESKKPGASASPGAPVSPSSTATP